MKISSIAASYKRKFRIAEFEMLDLESTLWADLDDTDVPVECLDKLHEMARESVRREFSRLKRLPDSKST